MILRRRLASRLTGAFVDASSTLVLALIAFATVSPHGAMADCQAVTGNNQTVICTGIDTDGSTTTFDGVTINVLDGATVGAAAGDVIFLNTSDGSTINLLGQSSISSTANASYGVHIIGDNSALTLDDTSSISATGTNARAIGVFGDNGTITLNDQAMISSVDAIAVAIDGTNNTVTLNDGASISTENVAALQFFSGSNTLVNYGTLSSPNATTIIGAIGGVDMVFNYGTVSSGTGTAIDLESGDDQITLGTGSDIHGIIDSGAGNDSVFLTGTGSEDDVFESFINLTMNGVDWSLSATSNFGNDIIVNQGRLRINALIFGGSTTIASTGTLSGSGTLGSPVTSTGTIAPGNSVGTLTIANTFSQTGGAFDIEFDSSGIDLLFVVNNPATLADLPSVHVTPLQGAAGANGVFLRAETGITGSIGAADYAGNGAVTLVQGANEISVIAIDGTPLVASNFAALQAGLDYLDTVSGALMDQTSTCFDNACSVRGTRHVWARGFGRFGEEDAQDGNQGFTTRTAGTAFGGDIEITDGFSLGGSVGYANTFAKVEFDAAESDIDGEFAALYADYDVDGFFVTGIVSGGLQQFDMTRKVAVTGGTETARADTDGWLAGGSVQAGLKLDFAGGWRLTPSTGIAYQHQSVAGYNEHGAGAGNVEVDDQTGDAIRLNAQLNVARTLPYDSFSLVPHISMGVAEQINFGDDVDGAFSTGDDFTLAQQDDDRVMALAGAGMDIVFANGVTANIDYQGQYANDADDHAVIAGIALAW